MQQVQNQAPPMSSKTMIGMFLVLIIMMVVMQFRAQIGGALDYVFKYIAFDGQYPVVTPRTSRSRATSTRSSARQGWRTTCSR